MTPEAQRIAILKACGWMFERKERVEHMSNALTWHITNPQGETRNHWSETKFYRNESPEVFYRPFEGSLSDALEHCNTPDYLGDLNAMHEAEKVLIGGQCMHFLAEISKIQHHAGKTGEITDFPMHATAAQRSEAFLKVLGLWDAYTSTTGP